MSRTLAYRPDLGLESAGVRKQAFVTATAAGDTTVVAAVANKKIRVTGFIVSADAAVAVKFRSNATDIGAPIYLALSSSGGMANLIEPLFVTAAGEALKINLSAIANVGVTVVYRETD